MAAATTLTAPTLTTTPPTPDPSVSLARCVGDVGAFLDDRFTVEPALFHGAGFDDLLTLADVDRQLTGGGLRRPAIRLVRDGTPIDPSTWTRRGRTGSTSLDDLADGSRVLERFAEGATIVLQSLHRWWPPLGRFCRELELVLGHATQANAYLTPGGAAGLAPHHDTHDVFVLQLAGTKHWDLREPLVEAPLPRHHSEHERAAEQPVVRQIDLRPGDCLYLPRGFIHSATAQEATSLHLTIGVLTTTAHDVLRALVDRAAEVPTFRRTLPPGFATGDADGTRIVQELVAELGAWLGQVEAAEVADELRAGFWSRRRPLLDGQLLELVTLDELDDDALLRRRPGNRCEVEASSEEVTLTLADRQVHLPAALAGVVARLLDGAPHRVGDLADLMDGPSRLVLARRLVREGVLQRGA
jgi:lysine-specific demethylase/histidyl-hydroxylase NO66